MKKIIIAAIGITMISFLIFKYFAEDGGYRTLSVKVLTSKGLDTINIDLGPGQKDIKKDDNLCLVTIGSYISGQEINRYEICEPNEVLPKNINDTIIEVTGHKDLMLRKINVTVIGLL